MAERTQKKARKEPSIGIQCVCLGFVGWISCFSARAQEFPQTGQHAYVFEHENTLNYLLYLPQSYGKDPGQKWPLLVFLHGGGETGDDVEKLRIVGPPKMVEQQEEFPFLVLSPQLPSRYDQTTIWDTYVALLDQIVARYAVDEERIYLTGLSWGGGQT